MTKKLKIEGINCHACSLVIKMNLEDSGFENIEVNPGTKELIVLESSLTHIQKIKVVADGAGHYKLII